MEPVIPVFERRETMSALDLEATVFGNRVFNNVVSPAVITDHIYWNDITVAC